MTVVGSLIAFGLRQVVGDCADQVVDITGQFIPYAGPIYMAIRKRLTDHGQTLPAALGRANDRAWQAVGLALAGDGLLDRVKDVFRDSDLKGVRDQIKKFLDQTPTGMESANPNIRLKAVEGGCYAKAIHLTPESEPDIFQALRFGAVLENVVLDDVDRRVNYGDPAITENTRGAYPIEYIPNSRVPCVGGHPADVVFLTCDAFGVLPPVSRLTPAQAMYYFISGYTAKVAGTEVGITEPQATFSPCFGGPFLVWRPAKYAQLLSDKITKYGTNVWLVNTGWSGGPYGVGKRMPLAVTRAIIDGIHAGALRAAPTMRDPIFGLDVVTQCPGAPKEILVPREAWQDGASFDQAARGLAQRFQANFKSHEAGAEPEVRMAGPAG